jgi:hypothetical protein
MRLKFSVHTPEQYLLRIILFVAKLAGPSENSANGGRSMLKKIVLATATAGALAFLAYSTPIVPTAFATGVQLNSGLVGITDDANLILVKKGGGGKGGKGGGAGRGGGGGKHGMARHGGGGGKSHAKRGGRGGKSHARRGGGDGGSRGLSRGGGGGKRYAYKGDNRRYGHDGRYRRYGHYGWYGAPFLAYGYYGGGCGWLYRNAVATDDPYWWNRYYECTGYY